jgi:SOS-response transcriptional repressor LexA
VVTRKTPKKVTTQKVYVFVRDYIKAHTHPPTLREIGEACFLATSSVSRHLDRLEMEGKIRREEGRARGITLLEPDDD